MFAVYSNTNKPRTFAAKLARLLDIPHCTSETAAGKAGLINWGSSAAPRDGVEHHVWAGNTPMAVNTISHKIRMFRRLDAGLFSVLD